MSLQVIVETDVTGVLGIEPHTAFGEVAVERSKVRRLYLAQLDMTDRGR